MGEIVHIPKRFLKDHADPREQAVQELPETWQPFVQRPLQTRQPMRWNDCYPHATAAAVYAMRTTCGPALDILLETFTSDEVTDIAAEIGRHVVLADRAQRREEERCDR